MTKAPREVDPDGEVIGWFTAMQEMLDSVTD
jgi:hypothetical protein